METGPGNVKIPPGCNLVIRCSKKFTALGLTHRGELVSILGPAAETDRTLRRVTPLDVCTLQMQTSKMARWEYSYSDRHKAEDLDHTPVEVPLHPEPIRYEDEMRRIVRDEMSRAADAGHQETFEEADDFDIADEYDPLSQYELQDMQEDYAPEPEAEAEKPEAEKEKPEEKTEIEKSEQSSEEIQAEDA